MNSLANGGNAEFLTRSEGLLRAVEYACDCINDSGGADIDNQRSGPVLALQFAKGQQLVINLQKPLQEVWMAAPAGGFHYRWVGEGAGLASAWRDTKTGSEFFEDLSRLASQLAGQTLVFNAASAP